MSTPNHSARPAPESQSLLGDARLTRAAWAFTTRRVERSFATMITPCGAQPQVGDLILARVDAIGHHANLHLRNGRRRHLFVGDEIIVAYGNRYASSQFEAQVPETYGPCHLVAGGGMASRALSWHRRIAKGPTHITPLGRVAFSDGTPMNLRHFALEPQGQIAATPPTIAVLGTAMDSGKTQSACYLARGLISAGLRVGYAKVTGTGAGGDIGWLEDAGANPVLDFTDMGLPSTYRTSLAEIESILGTLVEHIAAAGVDAILIEIADGLLQPETRALLQSPVFNRYVGGIVLAARDAMGACAGVHALQAHCATEVIALSGALAASPLQVSEAQQALSLEVLDRAELASAGKALELLGVAQKAVKLELVTSQAKTEQR